MEYLRRLHMPVFNWHTLLHLKTMRYPWCSASSWSSIFPSMTQYQRYWVNNFQKLLDYYLFSFLSLGTIGSKHVVEISNFRILFKNNDLTFYRIRPDLIEPVRSHVIDQQSVSNLWCFLRLVCQLYSTSWKRLHISILYKVRLRCYDISKYFPSCVWWPIGRTTVYLFLALSEGHRQRSYAITNTDLVLGPRFETESFEW